MGIGEGAIYAVFFIELQRHPRVATATGMYINIIISGGFAAVYAIEGYFDDFYYVTFGIIALAASLAGMFVESRIYQNIYKWAGAIILILLALNCLYAAVTIPHAALQRQFKNDASKHDMWSFGQYCNPNATNFKLAYYNMYIR